MIGREARAQFLEAEGRLPEVVVACVGGGSNAIGMFAGFVDDEDVRLVGVEAAGAASLGTGRPGVLHGARSSRARRRGRPDPRRALDLGRPRLSRASARSTRCCATAGRAEYVGATDDEALAAFRELARTEGIIPALEPAHALARARRARRGARPRLPLRPRRQGPRRGARAVSRCRPGREAMSTLPFPAELRVDELLLRVPEEADVERIAPAFLDPEVGGEAGLPPVDAETLRALLRDQLPTMCERGPALAVRDRGRRDGRSSAG